MRKFKIFLFIEVCFLIGVLILMVLEYFLCFLLILFFFLFLICYYIGKEGNNFFLVVVIIFFFFIVMFNFFVILVIFVVVIYSFFFFYLMMNQEKEQINLVFEEVVMVKKEKNCWFGNFYYFLSYQICQFDDINFFCFMGKDIIYLERVILINYDNVIIFRKMVGMIKIIVFVDVEVSFSVNCFYGDLIFFNQFK